MGASPSVPRANHLVVYFLQFVIFPMLLTPLLETFARTSEYLFKFQVALARYSLNDAVIYGIDSEQSIVEIESCSPFSLGTDVAVGHIPSPIKNRLDVIGPQGPRSWVEFEPNREEQAINRP